MSRSVFTFKQFKVDQTGATLKICTDSCLFGAWVAETAAPAPRVLDIGTGTGLLALMIAQQHLESQITALEIDPTSASLAQSNFDVSPWKERLHCCPVRLQDFVVTQAPHIYDLLICNPPFFENQLAAIHATDNLAKHSSQLRMDELIVAIDRLLSPQGETFVLLPPYEAGIFLDKISSFNHFLCELVCVRNFSNGPVIRNLLKTKRNKAISTYSELVIYEAPKVYSSAFVSLLKPYYLYL